VGVGGVWGYRYIHFRRLLTISRSFQKAVDHPTFISDTCALF